MTGSILLDAFGFGMACMFLAHMTGPLFRLLIRVLLALTPYGLVAGAMYIRQLMTIAKEMNKKSDGDE